jgi:Putative transposase of IS4/5 family (DUF4096)
VVSKSVIPMSTTQYEDQINSGYLPPESLWLAVEPLLPQGKKGNRGRPPACNRKMFFAIYYVLRTAIQWKALPSVWVPLPLCMTASSSG